MSPSFEAELAKATRDAKWLCTVAFVDLTDGRRAVSLLFPPPTGALAGFQHMAGKSLHVGLVIDDFVDLPAEEAMEDLRQIFLRAGNNETEAGDRTSFNPVTGEMYRNNVYGEAA